MRTMSTLALHEFHQGLNARFAGLNGMELVGDYGDVAAEHEALRQSAGVLDLGFRGRLCLTGADRVRFLHGQVTNDVKRLRSGEGCYSALVTAKGRMESDLNIYALADELLLDFEPGLSGAVVERLEKFLVSDEVQIVDAAPHYGLLSVQGPSAGLVVGGLEVFPELPAVPFGFVKISEGMLGEIYLMNQPRLGSAGYDLFVPADSLGVVVDKLVAAARALGGRACGWDAFEAGRIEAGIPRFGSDMDGTNLPPECGLGDRAVSYNKGCYIGQEVLNRLHSFARVNRELCGLRLAVQAAVHPVKGDKLFHAAKEVGQVTSATWSPALGCWIALAVVRREANAIGTGLVLKSGAAEFSAEVVSLPFVK